MRRPDILFYNKNKNELLLIEGKMEKNIKDGLKQLNDANLLDFIKLILKHYPTSKIIKGLCITMSDIQDIAKYHNLEFKILFALDTNGNFKNLVE